MFKSRISYDIFTGIFTSDFKLRLHSRKGLKYTEFSGFEFDFTTIIYKPTVFYHKYSSVVQVSHIQKLYCELVNVYLSD